MTGVTKSRTPSGWVPVVLVVLPGALGLVGAAIPPFDHFLVVLGILALNAVLLFGPRLMRPDNTSATEMGPGKVSLRLMGGVLFAALALYIYDVTRPVSAGLIFVFGIYVAVLMIRSDDPWLVPQRPPTKPRRTRIR